MLLFGDYAGRRTLNRAGLYQFAAPHHPTAARSVCRAALRASARSMPRSWFPKSRRARPSWCARRARASGQGAPS